MLLSLANFWRQHPALLYGISVLVGISFGFSHNPILLLPGLLLFIPIVFTKNNEEHLRIRLCTGIALCISSFIFTQLYFHFPQQDEVHGKGQFAISSITSNKNHFSHSWIYKGELLNFYPDNAQGSLASHLPCSILLNHKQDKPNVNCTYIIHGVLRKTPNDTYILKPDPNMKWEYLESNWSLAAWRFDMKNTVSEHIKKSYEDKNVGSFLAGIATGNFDDRLIVQEFSRFGLQHILAISGFHFAIIAAILGFLVRLFIPINITYYLLAFFLGVYFLFLGWSPSIIRACVTIEVFLLGFIFERRSPALNSLGVALIITLLIDPTSCMNLGFQLSFLSTAAILFFYSPIDELMQSLFRKRVLFEAIEMNLVNQWGYILLTYFRQGISLTLAVLVATLPVTLMYFHKFPFMSLPYNLFFPFMVSISMLLLLLGCLFGLLLPPLGWVLHKLNAYFTQFMLSLTYNIPRKVDMWLHTESIEMWMVVVYLTVLLCVGIYAKLWLEQRNDEIHDYSFI
jgi:competence protein ComEC